TPIPAEGAVGLTPGTSLPGKGNDRDARPICPASLPAFLPARAMRRGSRHLPAVPPTGHGAPAAGQAQNPPARKTSRGVLRAHAGRREWPVPPRGALAESLFGFPVLCGGRPVRSVAADCLSAAVCRTRFPAPAEQTSAEGP